MYLFQMQIVGKHYSQEASFQVRFGRSKISLDIPEDGKLTKEGWRLTPSTHPTVSDTEHCKQKLLLSSFAKEDIEVHTASSFLFCFVLQSDLFSFDLIGLQIHFVGLVN